jgi:putative Holliday junction resolvase
MRILGLDLGEKTIGVAVSDELAMTAQGLKTLRRQGIKADLQALTEIILEYSVDAMVVGVPRNMDGSLGPAAEKTLKFVEHLETLGIPVTTADERLTTVMAEKVLIGGNVRRSNRKKVIDKVAAILILQGHLDRRARERKDED